MAEVDIKKEYKSPSGAYVLFGEEDYLKRYYVSKIKESVLGDSAYALFNHTVFTPKDFSYDAALDALATPPVFDEQKLIELCEFNFGDMKSADIDALCDFLEISKQYEYAVIVLSLAEGAIDYGIVKSGKISKPSAAFKKLDAVSKTAYLPRASTRDLAVWAGKHFAKDRISADDGILRYLLEATGGDMMSLSGEIEKLCVYLHSSGRDVLTRADIDTVCCQTREIEPFGLSNAILAGNTDGAFAILRLMEQKHIRPIVAFSGIYSTYIDLYRVRACLDGGMVTPDIAKKLKMNEYRAKIYASAARNSSLEKISAILSLCRDADLKIKSETSDYDRVEMLVCEAARI